MAYLHYKLNDASVLHMHIAQATEYIYYNHKVLHVSTILKHLFWSVSILWYFALLHYILEWNTAFLTHLHYIYFSGMMTS